MGDKKPVILEDSKDAATYRTDIEGWVSRQGTFYGDAENLARWHGCTHTLCDECGAVVPKSSRLCPACREEAEIERHDKRERQQWDGETPLYSEACHKYLYSFDDVQDLIEEREFESGNFCTVEDLRLVICEPVYLRQIDEDYWIDDLPDDGELPEAIYKALEAFNAALVDAGVVSWTAGKYAVEGA